MPEDDDLQGSAAKVAQEYEPNNSLKSSSSKHAVINLNSDSDGDEATLEQVSVVQEVRLCCIRSIVCVSAYSLPSRIYMNNSQHVSFMC